MNGPLPFGVLSAFMLAFVLSGCSTATTGKIPEINKAQEHLQAIADAYVTVADGRGRPPQSASDLTPVLKQRGDPASFLKSPNDGEPYVIIWGLNLDEHLGTHPLPLFAYERKGANGKRYVVNTDKVIMVMTDDQFAKASFPKGHQPPK
jgi:hypothetical protein